VVLLVRLMLPHARSHGLIVHEVPGEVLVYDRVSHQAHCLNRVAALVWRACDGATPVADIASRLARELPAPVDEEVVRLALARLEAAQLLRAPAGAAPAGGLSRRSLLRGGAIAGGGALLLPLVSSITAPAAAAAASVIQPRQCRNGTWADNCDGLAGRPCVGGGRCMGDPTHPNKKCACG
jgi:hypothetical protein